jgi:hypothetical protein
MRSSPGNRRSSPPLKKKVTCAYFSVSAMRSCFKPALDAISPSVSVSSDGGNSAGMNVASALEYSTMPSTAANVTMCLRLKPSKEGSSKVVRICRARSARKLPINSPSPSFMPLKPSIKVGLTNSSVSSRA